MLVLEIAWPSGTARLARTPAELTPDWPPQPDRIFSALVASWGAGGEDERERAALEWLESQEPPVLATTEHAWPRDTVTVYVPPNDPEEKEILPSNRKRQARTFPAVALDADQAVHLALIWRDVDPGEHLEPLTRLAHRTSYVGHSSSLVRVHVRSDGPPPLPRRTSKRVPYPGRLAELRFLYRRHLEGAVGARPRPSTRAGPGPAAKADKRPFSAEPGDWLVFEHAGGSRPDLRATAVVADALRSTLQEAWARVHGEAPPAWITGLDSDGTPSNETHLAVVALANVGWEHSDGRLMGLAMVPPASVAADWRVPGPEAFTKRQQFLRAIAALTESSESEPGRLALEIPGARLRWHLVPATSGARSLDPRRYVREAHAWGSVTPVVLDRHIKMSAGERRAEIEAVLRSACARAGLPEPAEVRAEKYASHRGVPGAWPPRGNPPWASWARKPTFRARPLMHVRLWFSEPVRGPILLGAGRFVGMGLFLPLRGGPA